MRDNKPSYVFMVTLCVLVMMTASCSSQKPAQQSERASDSVDDVFDRGKDVFKEVAESVNNAVY